MARPAFSWGGRVPPALRARHAAEDALSAARGVALAALLSCVVWVPFVALVWVIVT